MSQPVLEPAERNPKKLMMTAITLVVVMVLGGGLVLKAYEKWSVEKSKDDRPAIVHQIRPERSLTVVTQDGSKADLMDLRGKVYLLNVIDLEQIETSQRSLQAMRQIAQKFEGEAKMGFVTLVLNPIPAEEVKGELSKAAEVLEMNLPRWWLCTNENETLKKFIRKELKPSIVPEKIDGAWTFDPRVVLIDKNGHLRRAVVPQKNGGPPYVAVFDFDQAASWDEDGKLTGTDLSNEEQLTVLLSNTVEELLVEPIAETKSRGNLVYLLIGAGVLILVFAFLVLRSRSQTR